MDLSHNHKIKILLPLLVLLIFVFLLNFKKIYAPEVFYHIKMGEIVSDTWSPVKTEQFSFIKKGIKIYHFEWLGDLILYRIYKILGFGGLEILKLIIFLVLFLVLFKTFSQTTQHYTLFSLLLILIAYANSFLSIETPVLFSLLFMSILISILVQNNGKGIYGIPLLFLIWANVHPGFIFGIVYSFLFLIGFIFEYFHDRRKENLQQILVLLFLLIVSIIFTFLTPFGLNLYRKIFQQKIIPDFIFQDELTLLKIFYIPFTYIFYLFILIISLYNVRAIRKRYLYPFLLLSWLPLFFVNTVTLLLFMTIPLLVQLINKSYDNNITVIQKIITVKTIRYFISTVPVLFAIFIIIYNYSRDISGVYGYGTLKRYYPATAIEFIKEQELYGKWFNSMEYGGALLLEGAPQILPFIYSGNNSLDDIYDSYYKRFINEPEALKDFLSRNDIIGVILSTMGVIDYSKHFEILKHNSYALVYWDDYVVILVNREMVKNEFLKSYELKQINPYKIYDYLNTVLTNNSKIDEYLFNEIKSSLERSDDSGKIHLIYGMSLIALGNNDEAERELRRSFEIQPYDILTNIELALFYQKLDRTDEFNYFQKRVEKLKKFIKG